MVKSILNDAVAIYTLIAFAAYMAVLVIIVRRFVQPFGYKALLVLSVVGAAILLISRAKWTGDPEWASFWHWFSDLSGEFNLSATFSAAQLLGISITALVICGWGTVLKPWVRLYWAMVAAVFLVWTADEYYMLHEGHQWVPIYATVGAALAIFSAAVFWYGLKRQSLLVFVLLFGGLGMAAAGGVVLEDEAARRCTELPSWLNVCRQLPYIEEALEIMGTGLALAGVLTFAQQTISAPAWPRARAAMVGGTITGVIVLMATFWIVSPLEARFRADRVDVRYLEGQIALIGDQIPERGFKPGDTVKVAFFWRAERWIPVNFNLSAQFLTFPDAVFVAEHKVMNQDPPASSWLPGVVRKLSATLTIPDDLDTPASLVVSAPLWYEISRGKPPRHTFVDIPLQSSSRPVFNATLTDLAHITVLPREAPPHPPVETNVRFASGFKLSGVALPGEAADTLEVSFWWKSDANLDRDMTQVFHLVEVGGDGVIIFDQAPFGGRFPTSDWVRGMVVKDTWTLTLPEDMPPGEYRVITGLYDQATQEREPVTGSGDLPVQDNLIELGILRKVE